ncbi:MAG: Txe/YoeB family addiction module toxin [Rhodothermales bacterium]|nr:Txe/YoeB family addiction module toxin [Rhodothermales bacterium]MBO6780062.1 Txe/YoeB family addiction module toxin [Rhodothermales bacterium]
MNAAREAVFHPEFREDLSWWIEKDRRTAIRLMKLVQEILRDPFSGLGKPKPLRHTDGTVWSRRLTQEHRLVYRVIGHRIEFLQARYHY